MPAEEAKAVQSAEDRKVPDDLLQKLHQANARLHEAKKRMDSILDEADADHQMHVNQAQEQFKLAERELEQVTLRIHNSLQPGSAEAKH